MYQLSEMECCSLARINVIPCEYGRKRAANWCTYTIFRSGIKTWLAGWFRTPRGVSYSLTAALWLKREQISNTPSNLSRPIDNQRTTEVHPKKYPWKVTVWNTAFNVENRLKLMLHSRDREPVILISYVKPQKNRRILKRLLKTSSLPHTAWLWGQRIECGDCLKSMMPRYYLMIAVIYCCITSLLTIFSPSSPGFFCHKVGMVWECVALCNFLSGFSCTIDVITNTKPVQQLWFKRRGSDITKTSLTTSSSATFSTLGNAPTNERAAHFKNLAVAPFRPLNMETSTAHQIWKKL